tara:strand:+ start:349 stop:1194 length:846 start_codon:yes stop_codon:yes gene_type:complete
MDTVIGLGGAGCNLAEKFAEYPQYKVLKIDSESRPFDWLGKGFKLIPKQSSAEDYERDCPILDDLVQESGNEILFIMAGGGKISGSALRILEQFKEKRVSILYVQPDTDLLPRSSKMQERLVFGVLQQYARSAVLERVYLVRNSTIEEILGDIPISSYYDTVNDFITSAVHMINIFTHTEPISSNFEDHSPVARITTFGMVNLDSGEESSFFPLQYPREKIYYYAINKNILKTDKGLHRKIMQQIKSKINNKEIDVTYGIYSTEYENDYVYSVANTSFVQE